jgi:hypothetical protein
MHVTLMNCGNSLGTADWDVPPAEGEVIPLRGTDGSMTQVRSVDKIRGRPVRWEDCPPWRRSAFVFV